MLRFPTVPEKIGGFFNYAKKQREAEKIPGKGRSVN
jgi:hypothetical protein